MVGSHGRMVCRVLRPGGGKCDGSNVLWSRSNCGRKVY